MTIGFGDFEGNSLWPAITVVHCLSVSIDGGPVRRFVGGDIPQGLALLNECERVVFHNGFDYDYPVIDRFYPGQMDRPVREDTIVLSRLFHPDIMALKGGGRPHSLGSWGMRLGFHKGTFDGPWEVYTEEMGCYCDRDTLVLVRLWHEMQKERLSHDWELAIRIEYGMAREFRAQEDRGWHFYTERAADLKRELEWLISEIESEVVPLLPLRAVEGGPISKPFKKDGTLSKAAYAWAFESPMQTSIAGPFTKLTWEPPNLSSREQLVALFKSQGWVPTEFTDKGNPKLTEDSLETAGGAVGTLLGYRFMLEKRLALVNGLSEGCRPDGRIPAGGISQGTPTGRATHRLVVNIPRPASPYGPETRSLFGVAPGRVFGNGDAAGLELRMLAHDMDDPAFTDDVINGDKKKGTGIHQKNAIRFGLCPVGTGPGHVLQQAAEPAKQGVYCLVYGGGDEKFGHTIGVFGKPDEWYFHEKKARMVDGKAEKAGRKARDSFLTALPKYGILIERVGKAAERGWIRGIDGRKLFIRHKHAALNTRLQANGSIAVKAATLKWIAECRRNKLDAWMVGHFHDEIAVDVSAEHAAMAGHLWQRSMEWVGRVFKFKVPLAGSWETGSDWGIH